MLSFLASCAVLDTLHVHGGPHSAPFCCAIAGAGAAGRGGVVCSRAGWAHPQQLAHRRREAVVHERSQRHRGCHNHGDGPARQCARVEPGFVPRLAHIERALLRARAGQPTRAANARRPRQRLLPAARPIYVHHHGPVQQEQLHGDVAQPRQRPRRQRAADPGTAAAAVVAAAAAARQADNELQLREWHHALQPIVRECGGAVHQDEAVLHHNDGAKQRRQQQNLQVCPARPQQRRRCAAGLRFEARQRQQEHGNGARPRGQRLRGRRAQAQQPGEYADEENGEARPGRECSRREQEAPVGPPAVQCTNADGDDKAPQQPLQPVCDADAVRQLRVAHALRCREDDGEGEIEEQQRAHKPAGPIQSWPWRDARDCGQPKEAHDRSADDVALVARAGAHAARHGETRNGGRQCQRQRQPVRGPDTREAVAQEATPVERKLGLRLTRACTFRVARSPGAAPAAAAWQRPLIAPVHYRHGEA